ncbi:MAG: hypothetical protein J5825_01730 [Lachnospiraceae bacterium]|nr:hypothetical protein [Lachnospiraceae bacterium]
MKSKIILSSMAAMTVMSVLAVGMLTGCKNTPGTETESSTVETTEEKFEDNSSEQSIFIWKNGTVTETIRESFQSDYYTLDELKTYVGTRVDEYTGSNPVAGGSPAKKSVSLDSLEMDGTDVVMKLTYATTSDYLKFNKTYQNLPEDAFLNTGSVDSMSPDGGVSFVKAGSGEKVSADTALTEAKEKKNSYCVSTNIVGTIYLEGRVTFVSDGNTAVSADSRSVAFTPVPIEKETQGTLIPAKSTEEETEKKPLIDSDGSIIIEDTEGAEAEGFTEAPQTEELTTEEVYETRADLSRSISEEKVFIFFK